MVVLFETGRCLYSSVSQQWVEEAVLHTHKELSNYLEFQYTLFSTFASRSPSFCYKELVDQKGEISGFAAAQRDAVTEAVKAYTPSLCIYQKDLYFFEEPSGELASHSLPDLVNTAYACGKEFSQLLSGVSGALADEIYTYTQRKIHFIDVAFQLLETNEVTPSQWCGTALDDQDVALIHATSVALDTLSNKIRGDATNILKLEKFEQRETNALIPVIMMLVLFVLSLPLWRRKNVFRKVFHQRFEHLWSNLQKIDQVLQRKLENLVMVLQCVTEQRILGRLKIICGAQAILVASDAPPGMKQMLRMMELLAHRALHHANTAALHVRLELQSAAETKEMVSMRQLLDGCLEVYKHDLRSRGVCATCAYSSSCPTSVLIDKMRVRSALLRILEFLCVECLCTDLEVKLSAKKAISKTAPLMEPTRNELKPFDIQVLIKARLAVPGNQPLESLLEGGDLRERRCLGHQLVSAKKVAVDLSGGIRVAENADGTTNFEFDFQAPGRFAPSDFHPNFDGLKNGLVFCMNMSQLSSYSQLTSVCELTGIKVQNVASIPELNDQLATSKQIRVLALFVYDNTTHLANAIPCSVPSIGRIAELVQVVKAKFPKQRDGKDTPVDSEKKPPILTAATVDSKAPRSMIVIEEPLTSSDIVSILAVGAGALDANRRRRGRGGALQRLSYGRASFWDAVVSTVNKPDNRASVKNVPALGIRGTKATLLLPMPAVLNLYKELILNKNKYEMPNEEQMGFQDLVKGRLYITAVSQTNECKGSSPQQMALGVDGSAYCYNIKTLFQMVQDGFEEEGKPPEPPQHQIALPNPDEVLLIVSMTLPRLRTVCLLEPFRLRNIFSRADHKQLNSHLALTPLALHPHRIKEFNRSQASVALEFLFSWDFDLTALPRIKSSKLACELFNWVARRGELEVSKEVADKFILTLQANYLNNSFHSFNHALHVAQVITLICKDYSFQRWFSFSDQFWMVIAALGHDVGHPGIGNSSLIASRNLCAIMFNERAVLESYHSFLLMELLRHPETDILEGFSAEVQQAARQRIVRAILATDPAFHFQLADELEALKAANPELNGPATLLDERIKDACLMRAADNAWVLTNFPLHRKWGERMVLELHFQNTLDEALKMPPSAPSVILPRDTCLATTMIHFIENVFVPFYSILAWFFPGDLDTRVCVMQANSATWEKIRQESSKIEGSHDVEELKEMRLSGISAALKALEEEMEYQSAKLVIDESASPQLINCYQYDETPYRILLESLHNMLSLVYSKVELKQRREERRRRRAEMSSDSGSDSSVETTVTEEQQDHAVEKPRPSISPLAEGFRSMIERELSKSRRQSQDTKGKEGDGSPLAPTEGLSPLPSNVIDELEPDIEPEGPLGYEADVQAIAALLASKRIEAAAEGKEEDPQTNCVEHIVPSQLETENPPSRPPAALDEIAALPLVETVAAKPTVEAQGLHVAQPADNVAVPAELRAPTETQTAPATDSAPEGMVLQVDEYGFVYDEYGYAYDAQGICRGYFGDDGAFYYYDTQASEVAENEQQQHLQDQQHSQ
ncbi:3 5 -cyclic nucleotide phosphodiesterase domain-containing protein [Cyclospora cayetanensis]|uniref:3 5-cyclic nucleotide phosphodiesterase domain-containing protein n=1 Tax=Cyclospora cayetanensis TaxID=88456 RepID=A0A1D3D9D1_9EIME|nr:3 5 -cyclic nucleotide phosphodiesterase domain-containing protein [Cyclospora cayetanensis]